MLGIMRVMMRTILLAAAAGAFASGAYAQDGGALPLTDMNFDLWCQEEQHLPPDRCDKRLPADDEAFEAYRSKIEKYEVPYLERKQQDRNFNRVILHADPIDHPTQPSQPQTQRPPRDDTSGPD
jgi:hypothetical protein